MKAIYKLPDLHIRLDQVFAIPELIITDYANNYVTSFWITLVSGNTYTVYVSPSDEEIDEHIKQSSGKTKKELALIRNEIQNKATERLYLDFLNSWIDYHEAGK